MPSIEKRVDSQWDAKGIKVNWSSFEALSVDILKSDYSDSDKLALLREAIDAFTRRGHFDVGSYFHFHVEPKA